MINSHSLGIYIHILLLVFWLGADVGVFLLALEAKKPALSFAERAFALRIATVIDFAPRLCFALMFPVGLWLAATGGWVAPPAWVFALVWLVSAGWIALLFALHASGGTPRGARLNRVHLTLQGIAFLVVGAIGISSVTGHGPFPGGWLGTKVLLFGLIFGFGIGIDYAFRPIVPAFLRLASEGTKPDIERVIGRCVNGAIGYVLALYAVLLIVAFLGVTKPF
jgi:hypothetical protein